MTGIDAVDGVDLGHVRPLLLHQGQHVVLGDHAAVLVGHGAVPADLAVALGLARGLLLAGQRHLQRVAGVDRGEEAQVVDAVVGQHRPGVGVDEQAGGRARR